ncbi:uncharacterized protein PITG_01378 [Phytophthora infestans T30-4]|uniref:U2A'/phosphoprotein 32 family A C-terminal domain-containing protein n=1 Tax=Phytophthora infestans (strain T30-4) TaxID=403677 RepID=D0MVD5_PHYIT|nr:uncharacterized protein PITG_01378 [Phytophthora infestans T30-4]EEY61131.1 conserved hypothetical protein [Phytophthora infestans T30-4]|eukprot:XP_002908048.1 conserved hypothetical protein [Phytophthora infestans T30-4]
MANKRIDKIANFDAFVNLEVLWINDNQIQELDGLDGCCRLKQLFAHSNCIRSLEGSSLPHFKFLLELRLYGNKLKDLRGTLRVLSRLSHLRDLDLFGNPVVEEENYRLQVIRAIPSLDVLDRHVITDDERARAARLQLRFGEDRDEHSGTNQHGGQKSKKQSFSRAGAPSQALSGTVKMLFKEVAAIKREQHQKEAREAAERELREPSRDSGTLSTTSGFRSRVNNNKEDNSLSGLGDWGVTALKKHFQSLEEVKNGSLSRSSFVVNCWVLKSCDSNPPPALTNVQPCNDGCKPSTPAIPNVQRASRYRSKATTSKLWLMRIARQADPNRRECPAQLISKTTEKRRH